MILKVCFGSFLKFSGILFQNSGFGISVHFSNKHQNSFSTWWYVTKCDPDFTESDNHPYLGHNCEPKTSLASRAQCSLHPKRTLVEDEEDSDSEQEAGEDLQVNLGASKKRKK